MATRKVEKLRVTGCGLQVAGYRLQVKSYELRVKSYGLKVTGYGLRVAGCGLRVKYPLFESLITPATEAAEAGSTNTPSFSASNL